ncbi:MAG: glycosyltransferase family 4 protein [Patescibacteria group bacterium]
MKIVYITDSFAPESVGGAGQVVLDLARGMMDQGHQVAVVTTTQYGERAGDDTFEGIQVIRIFSKQKSAFMRSYLSAVNPYIRGALITALEKIRPDIAHTHNVHEHFSFASLRWVRSLGIPVYITLHDTLSFSYTRLYSFIDREDVHQSPPFDYRISTMHTIREVGKAFNPFRKRSIQKSLSYATMIFAVSRALKDALQQNGITGVSVLYNGVREDEFQATPEEVARMRAVLSTHDRQVILFGGRALQDKGAEVLLDAMPMVMAQCPRAHIVMAIERGAYRERLLRIATQKGVAGAVSCIDLVHGRERAALFSSADVVVVPSIYFDPAPLMVLQAMAAGRPVIGTCFGGSSELIDDGVTGFVCNPFNTSLMVNRLIELLCDKESARTMGAAGLQRMRAHFSHAAQIEHTLAMYSLALIKEA